MRRKKVFITMISVIIAISLLMVLDIDTDRLLTYRELFQTKTNPLQRDTDSDHLSDGDEIERWTNPLLPDTDNDGILDGYEVYSYGTNPLLRDSDNDKVEDLQEINLATNPTNPDTDGDGLFDCESFPLDANRPSLTMKIIGVDLVKKEWKPFVKVSYDILADGYPLDKSWVHSSALVVGKLDWSNFHILINDNEIQFERGFLSMLTGVNLDNEINVAVRYQNDWIFKQFTFTRTNYTMEEIATYWENNQMPTESLQGDAYASMHKAVDEYAKVISGLIFLRTHISELKRKFTSIENWYLWLRETFYGATSFDSAWSNFQKYANASGVQKLVEQVWIELFALRTFPWDSLLKYPSITAKSLWKTAIDTMIQYILVTTAGDTLQLAITKSIDALEEITVQLASDFFAWISNASSIQQIKWSADAAQEYFNHLDEIRTLKAYYGVSFPQIIEPKLQYKQTGERGVAWWPAKYSFMVYGRLPFDTESSRATVFPLSEVRWKYTLGPQAGQEISFDVFLATESIVHNYLKENGFQVRYMPPTENEKTQFQHIRVISKYFTQKLDKIDKLFLNSETLAKELVALSNSFANFQMILDALSIARRYALATRFLEELNNNTWLVTNI